MGARQGLLDVSMNLQAAVFAARLSAYPHGGWLHSGTAEDSDRTCMTRGCQAQPAICAKAGAKRNPLGSQAYLLKDAGCQLGWQP